MHELQDVVQIVLLFVQLSFSAFGGITTVLPEMQHVVVDSRHWLTAQQFVDVYALGQTTPGPGSMMVIGIGYKVAGVPGAILALLATIGPMSVVTYIVASEWDRLRDWRWRAPIEHGIMPVTVGLLLAGTYVLVRLSTTDWKGAVLVGAAALLFLTRRVNPVFIILLGGIAGVLYSHFP
jgi:chromate transporter